MLKGFNYYSEGYYELPYIEDLEYDEDAPADDRKKTFAVLKPSCPKSNLPAKRLNF
ncbi:hypothetical protein [Mucilaginibacter humi]|uniref:hypothetical protein n=1 Tax=Mucilaginibacter humi TaxID=2732510 RepID=UPI001C2E1D1C|nr:hypothetical protein [Mucilaginibacter humi]